jgi:hypothetical protein
MLPEPLELSTLAVFGGQIIPAVATIKAAGR